AEASGDHAAFRVEPRLVEPDLHLFRLLARVDGDAAVSEPLRGREARMPLGRRTSRVVQLLRQRAHFLDTDHVRTGVVQKPTEPLLRACAEAVYVATGGSQCRSNDRDETRATPRTQPADGERRFRAKPKSGKTPCFLLRTF